MNKQFDVVVVKLHLRRAICQHFLLVSHSILFSERISEIEVPHFFQGLLTTMHTTVAVLAPLFDISNPLKVRSPVQLFVSAQPFSLDPLQLNHTRER